MWELATAEEWAMALVGELELAWSPKSPLGHISKCWMMWSGGQCRMRE